MVEVAARSRASNTAAAVVLAAGQFCIVAAFQAPAIILPAIGQDLRIGSAHLQWLVSATALSFGGLLPVAGRLADRFGARTMLTAGTLALALTSIAGAAAPGFALLLASRALQGAALAAYAPAMLALLQHAFDTDTGRRRALTWWNAAGGLGGILAIVGGGVLAQTMGWRPVLLIIAVPALVIAITTTRVFDNPPTTAARRRIPLLGGVLVSLAASGLTLTLTLADQPHDRTLTWISLAAAALVTAAWCGFERFSAAPMVPRQLRRWPQLQPVVVATLHGAAINTPIFFYALFAQRHHGAGPLEVGLGFLPCNVGLILGSWIAGKLQRHLLNRHVAGIGLTLVALAVAALTTISPSSSILVPFLPAFLVYGAGANIAQAGFIALSAERARGATATLGGLLVAGGQLGTATALALLTTLAATPADDIVGTRLAFAGAAAFAILGIIASLGSKPTNRHTPSQQANT
jgi:MFS family permease